MNATLIASILGSGVGGATILKLIDMVRNRKFDKRKQETSVQLDEATYAEIAARAANVNNTNLMAVGSFWQGQFQELAKQVENLEDWRRRAKSRLREHEQWDNMVASKMEECNMHIDPPPPLDPDQEK